MFQRSAVTALRTGATRAKIERRGYGNARPDLTRLARLSRIALARVRANAATAVLAYGTGLAEAFGGVV